MYRRGHSKGRKIQKYKTSSLLWNDPSTARIGKRTNERKKKATRSSARSSARRARDSSVRGRLRAVYILVLEIKKSLGKKIPIKKGRKIISSILKELLKKDGRGKDLSRHSTRLAGVSSAATGRKRGLNRINLEWHVDTTKGRNRRWP